MAAEFDNNMEDDFVDYVRERSNTWPRSQLKLAEQSVVFSPQFSPLASQCSSQLSLITESNESINTSHAADGNRWGIDTLNCRKQSSPAVISNYKAGHPSYVELITQAILSSPEKRMTLSEIYDWMVANVSAFKDQRHLHSSTGWKNSVRHNLSLHSRFKRVKRNGMDKPSWWMVDMSEEVKRDRRHRNLKAGARIRTSPRDDGTFNIPNVTQNYGNVNSVNSFNNQTNEISPLSNMTDPFVPQMVTLNPNQTVANVGGNHFAIYDVSDDNSSNFMTPLPVKQQQGLSNYAESCAKPGWYQDRSDWYCYDYVNTDYSASTEKHNKLSNDTFAKIITNNIGQIQYQQQQKIYRKEHTAVARLSSSSLSSCSFSSPSGDSVLHSSLETIDNVSVPTNLRGFAQAITVNLRDPTTIVGNGQCLIERPTITLNVNADLCPSNSSIHINHNNRGQSGRSNSAEEARQFLRVQTANGTVQDVTIPAPVQLKIVIRGEKSCQTDDLETDLQYRLHLNSPTELHYSNNGSVINYNGTSPETASANVCANDIMSNEQQQKSVNISPYHVFSENGLNGCVPDPLPWFQDTMKDGSQLGDLCESYNGFKFVH